MIENNREGLINWDSRKSMWLALALKVLDVSKGNLSVIRMVAHCLSDSSFVLALTCPALNGLMGWPLPAIYSKLLPHLIIKFGLRAHQEKENPQLFSPQPPIWKYHNSSLVSSRNPFPQSQFLSSKNIACSHSHSYPTQLGLPGNLEWASCLALLTPPTTLWQGSYIKIPPRSISHRFYFLGGNRIKLLFILNVSFSSDYWSLMRDFFD